MKGVSAALLPNPTSRNDGAPDVLLTRVLTALVLLPVIFAALFLLPRQAVDVLISGVVLLAGWEWARFVGLTAPWIRLLYAVAVLASAILLVWFADGLSSLSWLFWIAMLWWAIAALWILRYPTPISKPVAALSGFAVLVPAFAALEFIVAQEQGAQWLLFMLLLVWAADVGAYFAGRSFGRTKLAPRVSPGKTWAGVAGGVAATLLVAAAGAWWFGAMVFPYLLFGAAVAVVSIVGDLTVSMFKRSAGLKDSGRILPGHGGILDRIDSMTAAAPVFVLGFLQGSLA